jgi:hypothetical protein
MPLMAGCALGEHEVAKVCLTYLRYMRGGSKVAAASLSGNRSGRNGPEMN